MICAQAEQVRARGQARKYTAARGQARKYYTAARGQAIYMLAANQKQRYEPAP